MFNASPTTEVSGLFENSRPLDLICMGRVAVDLYAEQVYSSPEKRFTVMTSVSNFSVQKAPRWQTITRLLRWSFSTNPEQYGTNRFTFFWNATKRHLSLKCRPSSMQSVKTNLLPFPEMTAWLRS